MAAGSVRPLYAKKLPTPTFVHGKDGLGEIWVPESSRTALDLSAAEFIVETVMGNPRDFSYCSWSDDEHRPRPRP